MKMELEDLDPADIRLAAEIIELRHQLIHGGNNDLLDDYIDRIKRVMTLVRTAREFGVSFNEVLEQLS